MVEVTKELIAEVKKYNEKYPELTQADLAKFLGVSQAAVSRILNGEYDDKPPVETQIPYEKFSKLLACEGAIKELLFATRRPNTGEDILFIDFHVFSSILERFLPEEYAEQIKQNNNVLRGA